MKPVASRIVKIKISGIRLIRGWHKIYHRVSIFFSKILQLTIQKHYKRSIKLKIHYILKIQKSKISTNINKYYNTQRVDLFHDK